MSQEPQIGSLNKQVPVSIDSLKRFLANMGIQEPELSRAVHSILVDPAPEANSWPPALTGEMDLMPQVPIPQVPSTGEPPYFQPNTEAPTEPFWIPNVNPYPNNPTPDPKPDIKNYWTNIPQTTATNEPVYDLNGSNVGHTYNITYYPYPSSTNWVGTASDVGSQPPTSGITGFNYDKAIPEWRYPVEDSQINYDPYSIKIPPSGIREAILNLRPTFEWLSDDYLAKAKSFIESQGGKLYLIKAAEETITDHRSEGEPLRRKLAGEELAKMARTGIDSATDINHNPDWRVNSLVLDGDYNDSLRQLQLMAAVFDPEINRLITTGALGAVSINGGAPRDETVEPCETGCIGGCEMCLVPRGVKLAELDGIGFTWVVTDPRGIMWNGSFIPPAEPGVKTTAIQVV